MNAPFKILYCENQIYMHKTLLEVFDETFAREVKGAKNYPEAFERAAEKFENEHGFKPGLVSYDSYRMRKARRRKKSP